MKRSELNPRAALPKQQSEDAERTAKSGSNSTFDRRPLSGFRMVAWMQHAAPVNFVVRRAQAKVCIGKAETRSSWPKKRSGLKPSPRSPGIRGKAKRKYRSGSNSTFDRRPLSGFRIVG